MTSNLGGLDSLSNIQTLNSRLNIEDANVAVDAGRSQRATIKFQVTLSKASDVETTVSYLTLVGTAVDGFTGGDKRDYKPVTGTLTFAPGETSKEIEVTVFGDTPVDFRNDKNFEIFARDIAYRNWQVGEDADQINGNSPYGDLGYRVNQFFNDNNTGFQGVGLTSDEKFFLLISDPTNAEIAKDSEVEKKRLLTELEKSLGGKNSPAYDKAEEVIQGFQDSAWTFATGTIYDKGKAPILALRGTDSLQDTLDDFNPFGAGLAQFSANQADLIQWLQKVSQPSDTNISFQPHITGESLGGALTQWVASAYSSLGTLGDIVTFNAPGISQAGADAFNVNKAKKVTHYITSTDIVSLNGEKFIAGQYILSDYLSGPNIVFEHLHPVIVPKIADRYASKPANLSKSSPISVDQLNDFFFTYLPDPDYFAFLLIVANSLSPATAEQLKYRGTVELLRQNPNTVPQLIALNSINYTAEFTKETIQAAYHAAQQWSDVAWDAVKSWTENSWSAASKWTPEIWQSTAYWTPEIWQATTQINLASADEVLFGNVSNNILIADTDKVILDAVVKNDISSPKAGVNTVINVEGGGIDGIVISSKGLNSGLNSNPVVEDSQLPLGGSIILNAPTLKITVSTRDVDELEVISVNETDLDSTPGNNNPDQDNQDTGSLFVAINGTPRRDTLTGLSEDGIITGFQVTDHLTSGAGNDQVVHTSIRDRGDTITDFEVGKDVIVLTQLFNSLVSDRHNGINPIDGYVKIVQGRSDRNFKVEIDADGVIGKDILHSFVPVNVVEFINH